MASNTCGSPVYILLLLQKVARVHKVEPGPEVPITFFVAHFLTRLTEEWPVAIVCILGHACCLVPLLSKRSLLAVDFDLLQQTHFVADQEQVATWCVPPTPLATYLKRQVVLGREAVLICVGSRNLGIDVLFTRTVFGNDQSIRGQDPL